MFAPPEVLSRSMSRDGHGHSHHCGCEGEHEPAERGFEYGLYSRIDLEKMQCLNESRDGDGKLVFKPWDQRNERDKVSVCTPLTKSLSIEINVICSALELNSCQSKLGLIC